MPDISQWNTINITNINFIFYNCSKLISIPNISKWNLNNLFTAKSIFNECSSLNNIPDISKWNIKNKEIIKEIFSKDSSFQIENIDNIVNKESTSLKYSFSNKDQPFYDSSSIIIYKYNNLENLFKKDNLNDDYYETFYL